MTLSDLGAIGELVGGIAVIASLVYVGLQIRQSTAASQTATQQAFSKQFSDVSLILADAAVSDVFVRGLEGIESLKQSELVSFIAILSSITRSLESFYFQRTKGDFDPRLFDGWLVQYLDLYAYPGMGEFWAIRRHVFSDEFVAFVDGKIGDHRGKGSYSK